MEICDASTSRAPSQAPWIAALRSRCVGGPVPRRHVPSWSTFFGKHHGNVAEVARSLDRKWAVVWRWIGRLKLRREQFRV